MKIFIIALVAFVTLLGVFGFLTKSKPSFEAVTAQEKHSGRVDFPAGSGAHGRALYLVVDSQGVFLGDQLIDSTVSSQVVSDFASHEGIKAAMIVVTESAKYGDVVHLYAELRRYGLRLPRFDGHGEWVQSERESNEDPDAEAIRREGSIHERV